MRDECIAKRKTFSKLLCDACANSACRFSPFHYNIEYQREFAIESENPGDSNGEWKRLGSL